MALSYSYIDQLFPHVTLIREHNFAQQLEQSVMQAHAQHEAIMFAVDDVLFFRHVELSTVLCTLRHEPNIYAFHSKLHPNISYCHPATQSSAAPRTFQRVRGTQLLIYDRRTSGCTMDWNYPWDLCCSLYRSMDVVQMLAAMKDQDGTGGGNGDGKGLTHPNLLEVEGARLLSSSSTESTRLLHGATQCCCFDFCSMVVVTINRVQSIYTNPIYNREENEDNEKDKCSCGDVALIEQQFVSNRLMQLSDKHYQRGTYDSVHVGDWVLEPEPSQERGQEVAKESSTAFPRVTVLLPVYNAADFLLEALISRSNEIN